MQQSSGEALKVVEQCLWRFSGVQAVEVLGIKLKDTPKSQAVANLGGLMCGTLHKSFRTEEAFWVRGQTSSRCQNSTLMNLFSQKHNFGYSWGPFIYWFIVITTVSIFRHLILTIWAERKSYNPVFMSAFFCSSCFDFSVFLFVIIYNNVTNVSPQASYCICSQPKQMALRISETGLN